MPPLLELIQGESTQIMMNSLLIIVAFISFYGIGLFFRAPLLLSPLLGLVLVNSLGCLLVYLRADWCRALCLSAITIGAGNIIRCHRQIFRNFCEKRQKLPQELIIGIVLLVLAGYFFHNLYPWHHFKVEGEHTLLTKFYFLDAFHRAALSTQFLIQDHPGAILSPFGYPYYFIGYHLAGNIYPAELQALISQPTVITYHLALIFYMIYLFALLLNLATTKFTHGSAKIVCALICVSGQSFLRANQNSPGIFEYFYFNSSSFFGFAFFALGLMLLDRPLWAIFFIAASVPSKISLGPPALLLILIIIVRQWLQLKYFSWNLLKLQFLAGVPAGFSVMATYLATSWYPPVISPKITLRPSLLDEVSVTFIREWGGGLFNAIHDNLAPLIFFPPYPTVATYIFCLSISGPLLLTPAFFSRFTRFAATLTLLAWILGIILLSWVKTVSPIHVSIDPWITTPVILLPVTMLLCAISISRAFIQFTMRKFSSPFVSNALMLAMGAILVAGNFIRPELYSLGWKTTKISSERMSSLRYQGEILQKDEPILAAFFGLLQAKSADSLYAHPSIIQLPPP